MELLIVVNPSVLCCYIANADEELVIPLFAESHWCMLSL